MDPAIKFTEEGFGHAVNFLDVRITLGEDGKLHTTLYVKPNTKNQLLTPTFCYQLRVLPLLKAEEDLQRGGDILGVSGQIAGETGGQAIPRN